MTFDDACKINSISNLQKINNKINKINNKINKIKKVLELITAVAPGYYRGRQTVAASSRG
ncbi:MAG: hypothetical protein PHQ27_05270 [Victivallales bacterium]|nr:hypothetical protein [Victivallales bacterium]